MKVSDVQTVVLRNPHGPAVEHLILTVPRDTRRRRGDALDLLRKVEPSFGPSPLKEPRVSIGFSFAGLEALGVLEGYLRLLRRLAPAFADGAVLRSPRLGDSGTSAAPGWETGFQSDRAHVLLSWHGLPEEVREKAEAFAFKWQKLLTMKGCDSPGSALATPIPGKRLDAPPGQQGQWVHYGYRDGISEICIDEEFPRPCAPDERKHEAGELLLGEVNGVGANPFALAQAPEEVREFFRHGSFGILRKMEQDVKAFEQQIDKWAAELSFGYGKQVSRDFVKAKLCGRWPEGWQVLEGEVDKPMPRTLELDFGSVGKEKDTEGLGCPFGSHLRRMRAAPDGDGHLFERPLQRRSVPYGSAAWNGVLDGDKEERGLLGHFFCASIESQFEHLLGQWAARAPLGFAADDNAPDPVVGAHADSRATLLVPWKGRPAQRLKGFGAWTRTRGTMYAWYPGQKGLSALLQSDFEPAKNKAPWL